MTGIYLPLFEDNLTAKNAAQKRKACKKKRGKFSVQLYVFRFSVVKACGSYGK
jgi:hypothetical protein